MVCFESIGTIDAVGFGDKSSCSISHRKDQFLKYYFYLMIVSSSYLARFLSLAAQSIRDVAVKSPAHLSLFHLQFDPTHFEVSSAAAEMPTTTTPSGPSITVFHFENSVEAFKRSHR